ncbi:hypothetical protein B0H19DRAFT_1308267 [Mycena capillaripes]|nr:hypothetical protein B0H19DRAFT_1308267 [Mycena capillaripes]
MIFRHLLSLSFLPARCVAQSQAPAVTLWQFGRPRFLEGKITLPFQPIGTAEDGSATTYLYEVIIPAKITTTNEVAFTTITVPSTTARTIVASASEWVEFQTAATIACNFLNSSFGQCVDTQTSIVTANSGPPTPIVLKVDSTQTSPPEVPNTTPSQAPSPSPTNEQAVTGRRSGAAVAAIVGGAAAGTVALLVLVALLLFWRRRRHRLEREYLPDSNDVSLPISSASNSSSVLSPAVHISKSKRDEEIPRSNDVTSSPASYIPTPDLARILLQRIQNTEPGDSNPPDYATSG